MKLILGWIIDTVAMIITLPPHWVEHLSDILNAFPATQQCTSIKKWQETLGELHSMALVLPGSRNLFSLMQNAISTQSNGRITLNKGMHDALDNFQ
jgi:hypothetical protein